MVALLLEKVIISIRDLFVKYGNDPSPSKLSLVWVFFPESFWVKK
jgi:hypothetical protein